ncbi:MAG: replication-associated recombination protein A [Mycoplasmatales bacterium]|nr:replication-associated recombination protein A [Mycoplasmatales bacterium]
MSDFANNMRPKKIKDIVGQKHLIPLLKKIVDERHMTSLIFYGKPGIGKTSIAYALCNDLGLSYSYFNAASGSKKELEEHLKISDVVIIDEIHRLNKDKQDILLPKLERGKVKIIATTTENPFFTVVPALRSRTHILELKELTVKDIEDGLKKIIKSQKIDINIDNKILKKISIASNGDFRYAINSLNLIHKLYGKKKITDEILKTVIPSIHFYSDKSGDGHYDLLSAFHKSMRGSDIDASLYYLTKLIESGDILGMERRMTMVIYEDIGFADPNVTLRVSAALENVKKVGFPEARIILSFAVIDICKAAKSNSSYVAIENARNALLKYGSFDIPKHLKDSHYASAGKLDRGKGYKYPHDYGGVVKQQYLPDEIKDLKIYKKNENDKI